jgi:hypothetical protein
MQALPFNVVDSSVSRSGSVDTIKPVRRHVRQLGGGNITQGFRQLHHSEEALEELAAVLDVPREVRRHEVCYMPQGLQPMRAATW